MDGERRFGKDEGDEEGVFVGNDSTAATKALDDGDVILLHFGDV
jgi:hypothetical protein